MDYSTSINSQWPNGGDYDTLVQIYGGHVDSYNSFATTTATTTTTTPTTTTGGTSGCTAKGKSNKCNSAASASMDAAMGVKIGSNGKKEMWVAQRGDGGIWIHILYLVDAEHEEDEKHSH